MSIKLAFNSLVEHYSVLRQKKIEAQAAQDAYDAAHDKFLTEMEEIGTNTYNAPAATISVIETEIPIVEDWDAFYAFIMKNEAFELLQKRVGVSAYRERKEAGEEVPGLSEINRKKLRVTLK